MCTYLGMFTYLGIVVWIKVLQTGKSLHQTFCHFMVLHYISIPCYTIKYKLFSATKWSMRIYKWLLYCLTIGTEHTLNGLI